MAGSKKRRKLGGTNQDSEASPGPTKLTINSWEDVANSGDEFEISRDKILLEEAPARKKQRRLDEEYEDLVPSDEDLLELPTSDEEDNSDLEDDQDVEIDEASVQQQEDEVEANENWGTSRKDYYNTDVIETEVDALEEEEEALRLQQKQLKSMTEADFGFDEADWLAEGEDGEGEQGEEDLTQEILPQLEILDDLPEEERKRILTSRYPEFEALSKEFVALEDQYEELSYKVQELAAHQNTADASAVVPGSAVKWRSLGAYLGVLSIYFVLLTSGPLDINGKHTTIDPIKLRRHPIMESLVQARTQWHEIKDLALSDPEPRISVVQNGMTNGTSELTPNGHSTLPPPKKHERKRKSKAQIRAARAKESAVAEKAAQLQQTKDNLAQIAATSIPSKGSLPIHSKHTNDISDFGELSTANTIQQDRRKKSLAFYTSQIASKSQKRSLASKGAGGDDDIPYRERFRDRVARLNAQAQARGQNGKDKLGSGSDNDEEDARIAAEVRTPANGNEDYYQTIASKTQHKKDQKVAKAAALAEAKAQGAQIHEVEQIGADGKRAITYAIEKNKGLTPKRKKEVRNPRVKKRLKYEEKMKKLGSIRQVYKGGEGCGGYGGEMTGIKSSIVRSRKL